MPPRGAAALAEVGAIAGILRSPLARVVLALLLLAAAGPAAAGEWKRVPRPVLENAAVTLRVAHAVNPRLPRMAAGRLDDLLAETRRVVAEHFGVTVAFTPVEEITIEALFRHLPASVARERRETIFDFKGGTGDATRLAHSFEKGLRISMTRNASPLVEQYRYAEPYLLSRPGSLSVESFAAALADTILRRIRVWRETPAADGTPVIDGSGYNEWVLWDTLGYGAVPYDVVITNQLVASVEYTGLGIHAAIRGGITAGATSFDRARPLGSYVFLSTFVFENGFAPLAALRGGNSYGADEAATLAGAYLAHELGHQLLHLGHPFGASGCVMTPARLLDFRGWYRGLDAAACSLGSHPAMRPGRPILDYNERWLRMATE